MRAYLNSKNIKSVAEVVAGVINDGGIAVIPTDTLYGIVCSAFNKDAVEKIYRIKGREENKPFLVLIQNEEQIESFSDFEPPQKIKDNIPGALTFIVPLKESTNLSFTKDTVALRCPDNEFLLNLIELCGPIVAPSANKSNIPPNLKASEVADEFEELVDIVVLGRDVSESAPSTIYDCVKDVVIREGKVKL